MNTWGTALTKLSLEASFIKKLKQDIGIGTIEGLVSMAQFPYGYNALLKLAGNDESRLKKILDQADTFLPPQLLSQIKTAPAIDFPLGAVFKKNEDES